MDRLRKHSQYFLIAYAFFLVVAGCIYLYAGIQAPVMFSMKTSTSTASLQLFFEPLQISWIYYAIAFMMFVLADFALIMIGICLAKIFHDYEPEAQWILVCFAVGGLLSFAIDLMAFAQWQMIGMGSAKMATSALSSLWTIFYFVQTIGMWGSILWFILMAIGIYFIYRIRQSLFTLLFALLLIACAIALILTIFTSIQLPALILFLLANLIVAPIWCIRFARTL